LPSPLADRCELSKQVVHRHTSRRLPMASESSDETSSDLAAFCSIGTAVDAGAGESSRKATVGAKKRFPVTAVEKSRIRSVVPDGSPTNMFVSIRSITAGDRAYPMK